MIKHNCAKCRFRAIYDTNTKSPLGRVWRWHIGWCPGWKGYMETLSADESAQVTETYGLKK